MPPHKCSVCNKGYSSASHLNRHTASHRLQLPFPCTFCGRSFSRTDTMRRHSDKCPERNNRVPVARMKRGPRATTCDRCSRSKIACDRGYPCGSCLATSSLCYYSRRPAPSSRGSASQKPPLDATDFDLAPIRCPRSDKSGIPFLLTYTNPTNSLSDLRNATGSSSIVPASSVNEEPILGVDQVVDPSSDIPTWLYTDSLSDIFGLPTYLDDTVHSNTASSLTWMFDLPTDPLQQRIETALDEVAHFEHHLSGQRELSDTATGVVDHARIFLSANSLRGAIDAYFRYVYHNFPLVHQPSFDPQKTSTPLLLAIYIAGSLVLPQESRGAFAEPFAELAERYIFEGDDMKNIVTFGATVGPTHEAAVEVLQAATVIISANVATHNSKVDNRIRNQRFPALLSAIRTLGLTRIRNLWVGQPLTSPESDWRCFLRQETLVRITAMAFLLDSHFMIFYRTPPRCTIAEMTGSLPCADELFASRDPSDFESHLQVVPVQTSLSLSTLLSLLMGLNWSGSSSKEIQRFNMRSLFMAISALHSVIFTATEMLTLIYLSTTIETALDRWKQLWDNLMGCVTNKQWHDSGFMKYANEFCWLAKTILHSDFNALPIDRIDTRSRGYLYTALAGLHSASQPRREAG